MRFFKVEIPWPYTEADEEADRLVAAGCGVIRRHDVLDAVLDLLEDSEATFVVTNVQGETKDMSAALVRELREEIGMAFWLPRSIPE